ncbi:hypothetical protein DMUE_5614, partial [Dictyocoela muelleri]
MEMQQNRLHCIFKNNRGKYLKNRNLQYSFKRRNKIQYGLTPKKVQTRSLISTESSRNVVLGVLKDNQHLQIPLNLKKTNDLVTITRKNHNYTTIKDYDIPSEL